MTTQFILRAQKMDAAGRCPVHLIVYLDGARLVQATGEKCKPADWNADRQQFRRSFAGASEANDYLALRTRQVGDWWRKVRAAGEAPTVAALRMALQPAAPAVAPPVAVSVAVPYEQYREAMRARGYARETLRQHVAQPVDRV